MAYVILPNSGQSLGVTRPQINTNFALIQQIFDINHYDFNAANAGKHTFVTLPIYSAIATPPPLPLTGEGILYTATVSGETELFYARDNSGGMTPTPLANYQLTGTVDISTPTVAGSTSLPGGLMMQWGSSTGIWNGSNSITFKTAFTLGGVNTAPYSITYNMVNAAQKQEFTNVFSSTAMTWTPQLINTAGSPTGTSFQIYWMAIGPNT
jgi:hypothetical protein